MESTNPKDISETVHSSATESLNNAAKMLIDLPYYIYIYFSALINVLIRKINTTRKSFDSSDVIIVTGAATGIGENVVLKLAKHFPDAQYVLWDINKNGLEETARKCREFGALRVHTFIVDLSNKQDVSKTADSVRKQFGGITVLWNNAGIANYQSFLDGDSEIDDKVIRINLLSYMWIIKEFLPDMISGGKGHVISTCSGLAFYRWSNLSSYVTSKYGLRGFLETLKLEMRQHPGKPYIKFSTIYPGFTKTGMIGGASWEPRYRVNGLVPMEVDDVGDLILDGILKEEEEIILPGANMDWICRNTPLQFQDKLEHHLFRNLKFSKPN